MHTQDGVSYAIYNSRLRDRFATGQVKLRLLYIIRPLKNRFVRTGERVCHTTIKYGPQTLWLGLQSRSMPNKNNRIFSDWCNFIRDSARNRLLPTSGEITRKHMRFAGEKQFIFNIHCSDSMHPGELGFYVAVFGRAALCNVSSVYQVTWMFNVLKHDWDLSCCNSD